MTDNVTTDTTATAPTITAPVAAAVTETVITPITPVVPAADATSQGGAPDVAPTTVEPAKADALTNVMADTGTEAIKTETKPEAKTEAPAGADTKTAEGSTQAPAETKVELPTYEIKFPDGITVDKEPLDAFTKLFAEIETGKLDHKAFQEKAQNLADMHVQALNKTIERYTDSLVQIHDKQKVEWFEGFKKDAEIGGENIGNTTGNIRDAIDNFGGSKTQIKELRDQMVQSGYGNYTPLLRLLNNMQTKINSYTKEKTGGIVPGSAPAPVKTKDYQRFYGGQ